MSFRALQKFTPSGCWSASCVGLEAVRANLVTNPATHGGNRLGKNPLVSGPLWYEILPDVMHDSAFLCDTTTYGYWRIEPRRRVARPEGLSGVDPCKISYTDFPENILHALR
jgi:hypothetical protein